jgi:glucokinase
VTKRVLLAGDVGGTKTNLALFTAERGALEPLVSATVPNHGRAGLEAVVGEFLAGREDRPAAACFGIAGPVTGERIHMPNLGWWVDARALEKALGVDRVVLLNDLEATAYGIATLAPDRFAVLNEGAAPAGGATAALIAAGTGLGEAVLYWDGARHRVCASEGGHADFGPRDAEQTAILDRLRGRFGHVSWERLVSGPGLHNVYDALDLDESPAVAASIASAPDASARISELALAGGSARCVRALDCFVACYGAAAGNLALQALATGGVYVGGGIAPKIVSKLRDGAFLRAFCDKGRLAPLMERIPVKVILDPTTALRGAAAHLAHAADGS